MEPEILLLTDDEGTGEELSGEPEAESPFIEGTNIQWAWDATCLGYLKTCPQLYKYIIIDGWQSEGENVHLRFGSEVHIAEQEYYTMRVAGINHEESLHEVVRNLLIRTHDFAPHEDSKPGKYKNRRTLLRLVIDSLDQYNLGQDDPAGTYIKDDGTAAVELSFRFELDISPNCEAGGEPRPYTLCGHLDRVVEFNDELFVMDYKTATTTLGDYYFNQFDPNNQMSLYTLAGRVVLESNVKGVIIQGMQILLTEPTRSVRSITYRTEDQLDEWLQDFAWWMSAAEVYAENNYWPKNDTACSNYGGCRFQQVCSKSPGVREKFLKSNFKQGERWNPLKVR